MADRFTEFRGRMKALEAYREAYSEARGANPGLVAGLPDPDDDPKAFDPATALKELRGRMSGSGSGEFRPVARRDIKT